MTNEGFTTIDFALCAAYLLGIVGLGVWCSRGQRTARDFFLAGRGIGWFPLGLSLMVTLASSVGFIGAPTAGYRAGVLMLWSLLAIPLSIPVVVGVFMPFYNRLQVYTPYEYLEKRFGLRVRLLASALFILWRIAWMAATIYAPSMVLHVASGRAIPLWAAVVGLGLLATAYTALGGMRAVVWTDVAQFFVLFGGVAVVLVFILHSIPGGLAGAWHAAQEAGKTQATATIPGWQTAGLAGKARLYLYTDFTALAIIISFTLGKLGNYCVDQVMVQRYLSAPNLQSARRAFLLNCVTFALFFTLMAGVGIALVAFKQHAPFPPKLRPDQVFPYFMSHFLPAGVAGLVVSGLIAAAMSSIDSGVNSCIAAISNDFVNRLRYGRHNLDASDSEAETSPHSLRLARVSSLALGIAVILLACVVGELGDVFTIALKLVNSFIGPLFGVFTLAMFTRFATTRGAFWATALGTAVTALIVVAEKLGPALEAMESAAAHAIGRGVLLFDIGFLWTSVAGFAVTFLAGLLLSVWPETRSGREPALTFAAVMRTPDPTPRP